MEINHIPFLDVIDDITSKFNKIPNKNFINEGEYPIIDQGANLIAGYTNAKSVITDLGYPVIVFGDHTRILKFINYPFAIGADGVKVFSVDSEKYYPLYVFYFLKFLKIPNAGYSRHYKFLKERKVAIPKNIDDQKRIAKVLSKCEELIQKRKESIDLLDKLLKSTFGEMFRDIKGEEIEFGQIIDIQEGLVNPNDEPYSEMYHVGGSNIESNTGKLINLKKAKSENLISGKFLFKPGYILYSKIRPYLNKVALMDFTGICSADIYPIKPKNPAICNAQYLRFELQTKRFLNHANNNSGRANIPKINRKEFNSYKTILPEPKLQVQFAEIAEKIDLIKTIFYENLKELENLYGSTSQRAFNGELDLSKVDISDMKDSKKKDLEAVKEITMEDTAESIIQKTELLEIINKTKDDDTYLSKNCRLYVNNSKDLRSKIYSLSKKDEIGLIDFRNDLTELNKIGEQLHSEVSAYTPWQIDQHKSVERYIPMLSKNVLDEYPNVNVFSRHKFEYNSMTLDDYYGIPDEVITQYGNIEDTTMDLEFFFKKYFSKKLFSFDDIEALYNKVVYDRGYWMKYNEIKEYIFRSLETEDALLVQSFEEIEVQDDEPEKSKTIKKIMLKVYL